MLRFTVVLAIICLGIAGWWHHRASQQVALWITELRPHLLVRYDGLRALPWEDIHLQSVTLEPVGTWREGLGLPVGYRIHARQLQLGQPAPSSGAHTVKLLALSAPMDGLPSTVSAPLQRSGVQTFGGDLTLRWQPPLAGLPSQIQVNWHNDPSLSMSFDAQFIAGPQFPAMTLEGTTLVNARVNIVDMGLLPRLQQSEALAARRTVNAWAATTLQQIDDRTRTQGWKIPESQVSQLRGWLRQPQSFTVEIMPPAPVRLDHIHLYAPEDRWALMGISSGALGTDILADPFEDHR